jgi:hypothetical protein
MMKSKMMAAGGPAMKSKMMASGGAVKSKMAPSGGMTKKAPAKAAKKVAAKTKKG